MSKTSAFLVLLASVSASKLPPSFSIPKSDAVDHVNALIGNGGDTPNGSGGMIPSTAPPFAMTRWVAQTHENYVSVTPYNYTASNIHGFQGTHQPAIWMGESAQVVVVPGIGDVKSKFEDRALKFSNATEVISPSYYSVDLDAGNGNKILAEQSATSRVGHLRFTFPQSEEGFVLLEATRPTVITSTPTNITYPLGSIAIDPTHREITGSNSERQDWIITPTPTAANASHFRGYFCARFDAPFAEWGIVQNGSTAAGTTAGDGSLLSGYARFAAGTRTVNVRVGVSFISVAQARRNLDNEISDGVSLEETARRTRAAWAEKLDRITLEGASEADKEVFYTAFFHSLQFPYEQDEDGHYYSAYDNQVHKGQSYTGYSIWDTFRAEWAWLILFAPERVPAMITSMLQDYQQSGWLPMWKNIVETNIMVGTHADSLVAEAVVKGVKGFDTDLAWEAAYKDGVVPPENDRNTTYSDREENVGYEVRAGLSSVYADNGWVADDVHSESASRTLDYAYDDYALYRLAGALGKPAEIVTMLYDRAMTAPFTLFNNATGFMEARNADGGWAGPDAGWTEGDKWAYTFDVVHDIPALARHRGGNVSFVSSLDAHFDGGHNDHSNEPSHHIPYLYALAGAASKTQERVREIAKANYNNTPVGLSGNEDCGQMSAWYLFSALGFYPVNPASGEYVVGSPFFDKVTVNLPSHPKPLTITAKGAPSAKYIRGLTIDDQTVGSPVIRHEQIAAGADVRFEMSEVPETWGGR
ncbi:glycosyl hydrolase family 92-domain-containing protein [Mycena albidolilacea]|uniref:Glycosyl hydrolase family 92-domain-containing protein n=1 Tax=Mycena albidolilacea TaxID=1033008 RepID=A0AAD6ZX51_9AGAR|nr:glycosyl hydrolase family 92-domain-containing protein [Mycena albidolilacea]